MQYLTNDLQNYVVAFKKEKMTKNGRTVASQLTSQSLSFGMVW